MQGRRHSPSALAATALGMFVGVALLGPVTTSAAGAPAPYGHGLATLTAVHLPKHTNPAPNPVSGFPESWGLTRHDALLIGAGLLITLLLLVILVLRVRRRRRAGVVRVSDHLPPAFPQSAESWRGTGMVEEPFGPLPKFQASTVVVVPTQETGWHPVQGDRTRIAYWDGTKWSSYRRWDGQQWVEATSTTV
jgi:hypothetical protein